MKLVALIYLIFLVWIVSDIWKHPRHSDGMKILWTAGVIVFPFVGSLLWMAAGNRISTR